MQVRIFKHVFIPPKTPVLALGNLFFHRPDALWASSWVLKRRGPGPVRGSGTPPYNTKLGRAGRPGEAPWLLFSIINRSQGEREKSIISSDFLPNRRDPIQDPTGSAVVRYHELCFSLGFGAFFATGS